MRHAVRARAGIKNVWTREKREGNGRTGREGNARKRELQRRGLAHRRPLNWEAEARRRRVGPWCRPVGLPDRPCCFAARDSGVFPRDGGRRRGVRHSFAWGAESGAAAAKCSGAVLARAIPPPAGRLAAAGSLSKSAFAASSVFHRGDMRRHFGKLGLRQPVRDMTSNARFCYAQHKPNNADRTPSPYGKGFARRDASLRSEMVNSTSAFP